MFKPILQLAAVGLAGFALWKLGSFFFIPLLFLAVKVALVIGLVGARDLADLLQEAQRQAAYPVQRRGGGGAVLRLDRQHLETGR